MLLSRYYNKNIIKNAFEKIKKLDRLEVLKKVEKKQQDRVILALRYHPNLTSVSAMIKTHWHTMISDHIILN